jgi:hypothetical protein
MTQQRPRVGTFPGASDHRRSWKDLVAVFREALCEQRRMLLCIIFGIRKIQHVDGGRLDTKPFFGGGQILTRSLAQPIPAVDTGGRAPLMFFILR